MYVYVYVYVSDRVEIYVGNLYNLPDVGTVEEFITLQSNSMTGICKWGMQPADDAVTTNNTCMCSMQLRLYIYISALHV